MQEVIKDWYYEDLPYNMLRACEEAMKLICQGARAIEAVEKAVQLLERNKHTNAGYGSNLTLNGEVECDASIMDGFSGRLAAVGALKSMT